MKSKPRTVLITPQHWGLGHVTRTIPIIRYFISEGWNVLLGSSGPGAELLRREFPSQQVFELPDYMIVYPSKNMYWNIAIQMYKMHSAIIKEYFAIGKICRENNVDLLISDARLGAAQSGLPCAIITHHLHFPLKFKFFEWCADTWMRFFYMRFNQIWIPDFDGIMNLGGSLDHQFKSDKHHFIGALSRFQKLDLQKEYQYCFMLSGPEPQRSRLETLILQQLKSLKFNKSILIRGTESGDPISTLDELEVVNLATSDQLNRIMCASELIVCRSGYSTLLDLSVIRKKALLIPTPGQPEQEYLAKELMHKKLFYCTDQDDLNLKEQIPLALELPGYMDLPDKLELKEILPPLLSRLNI